jgi:UDP-N-acetylglucosamine 3-dehydrogenase
LKNAFTVAVIGAGFWGKKVINEYLQLGRDDAKVDLSMVCDTKDENLTYCREEFGVSKEKLKLSYKEVFNSSSVDAVHICTPNETHHEICKQALLAGKHVLLEKPMAMCAKHAWELVGLAEHNGLILQVGHIFRFSNALKTMRDLVTQDYFGTLYYLKLQWTTLMSSPLGRDIIFDLGPHPVDILNCVLKRWPSRVTCKARAYRRRLLEELAYFTLEFDTDLIAQVELSWLQPGKVRRLDVIGSERSAVIDCLDQTIQIHENGDRDAFSLDVVRNNTIFDEVDHFAHSVMSGENSSNPGSIGATNTAVLEALKRSLEENKTREVHPREAY